MRPDEEELLKARIRSIPDYPKPGIIFRDITPLLKDRNAFSLCIDLLVDAVKGIGINAILGIEARGFIIGSAMAYAMELGFIPARKKGKLPYKTLSRAYSLEYGSETLEMHNDSVDKGERVLIVDDLLATGGTASAAGSLVSDSKGLVAGYAFAIELEGLKGRMLLQKSSNNVFSLLKY